MENFMLPLLAWKLPTNRTRFGEFNADKLHFELKYRQRKQARLHYEKNIKLVTERFQQLYNLS